MGAHISIDAGTTAVRMAEHDGIGDAATADGLAVAPALALAPG